MVGLAKLAPPSAAGLVPRPRLFARLDETADQRLAWIAALAGAGKTSLAVSWLAAHDLHSIWYRVDADDKDAANFFHYLALAARKYGVDLPHLTPEYLPGLPTFARRFFRTLFAALPGSFVLALDNYQETGDEAPMHLLLAIAAEELPSGGRLLVISRRGPPPVLTRTFTRAVLLDDGDLRFTQAETGTLLEHLDIGDAQQVQAATDGWAAGIILTARAVSTGANPIEAGQIPRAVLDFIAAEIFDTLPADWRDFLLRMGLFPLVTETFCVAMTGNNQGMDWLAELHRAHLFVTPQAQDERAYEFHPLLRAFLAHRLEAGLAAAVRGDYLRQSAAVLEQAGMIEPAVEAWARARDWTALGRLICLQAPVWLASGRHASVLAWIERLPAQVCEASPWLVFWSATCRALTDLAGARADFEHAYAAFKAAADLSGRWLCWAGIAETYLFGWDSLAGFDPWIEELESLLAQQREFPSPEVEARVLSGAVALAFRRPEHPLLPIWAERALNLIRTRQVQPHTAMLAHFAGVYHMWRGHTYGMDAVLEVVRVVATPMTPLGRILMGMLDLVSANFQGDAARMETAFSAAMEEAREHGIHLLDVSLIQNMGLAALARGDADRLEALIHMTWPALLPDRWLESSAHIYQQAGLALLRGDHAGARAWAIKAFGLVSMGGIPHWVSHLRLFMARLEILEGKGESVVGELESIVADARITGCDLYLAAALLSLAALRLETGDHATAAGMLREALALGAHWNYGHLFLYAAPDVESRLCAFALEMNIEPCYVKRLIRQRGLLPPENADECWPWTVRVFTLGGFRLLLNGEAFVSVGKPQKKPLELLKALVAQGPSGAVARNLAALLWPDAEGETLKKTLDITLHRLRKLLGGDNAVLLQEGKLSLNPKICWCDVWVFERMAERVISSLQAPVHAADVVKSASARALHLFNGAFLATEEDSAWLLPARDHALSRFQRLIAGLGRHHEQTGNWEAAGDLYRRGLEQDNLNEFFYRRLIFCLQKQNRHTEALCVYRRCRELLSIVLGVAPSAETESLIRLSREG